MFKKLLKYYPIIFIILISLVLPGVWLKDRLVIAYLEGGYSLFLADPIKTLKVAPYLWHNRFLGFHDNFSITFLLFFLFNTFLQLLKLSPLMRQFVIFSVILFSSGITTYFLALKLFTKKDGEKDNSLTAMAFLTALFYLLNPFVMTYVWHRYTNMFILGFIPICFLAMINFVEKPNFKRMFFFAFAFLISSMNLHNPAFFSLIFLIFLLLILFHFRVKKLFLRLLFAIMLTIGFDCWWIFSFIPNILTRFNQSVSVINSDYTLKTISQSTSLINVFRLMDNEHSQWLGVSYRPGLTEFILPILAILALLINKRHRIISFFSLLLIIGLFLSKGIQPPLGNLFYFLFSHIKFLQVFRNPIEKSGLIVAVAYAFLIPYAIINILKILKIRLLKILFFLTVNFLLFYVCVWPMWTGEVFSFSVGQIPGKVDKPPTTKTKIPEYWKETVDFINKDKVLSRTLILPQSWLDSIVYKWKYGYFGGDSQGLDFNHTTPINEYIYDPKTENFRMLTLNRIYSKDEESYLPLFGFLNIKYLLIRNDVDAVASNAVSQEIINQSINDSKKITLLKSFGKVDLYEIDQNYYLPRVYVPKKIIYLSGQLENLTEILKLEKGDPRIGFYHTQTLDKDLIENSDEIFIENSQTDFTKVDNSDLNLIQRNFNLNDSFLTTSQFLIKKPEEISLDDFKKWQINVDDRLLEINFNQNQSSDFFALNNLRVQNNLNFNVDFVNLPNLLKNQNWETFEPPKISDKNLKATAITIPNWQPNLWYLISGKINTKGKSAALQIVEQLKGDNAPPKIQNQFNAATSDWQDFSFFYKSLPNVNQAKFVFISGDLEGKNQVNELKVLPIWDSVIFLHHLNSNEDKMIPKIIFNRINPTKYSIIIQNAREAYTLVFSDSFDPGWKLYLKPINKQDNLNIISYYFNNNVNEGGNKNILLDSNTVETWFKKPIAEKSHRLINGYANSWYIKPEDTGNQIDYELILEFTPQRLLYSGLFISGLLLFSTSIYLIIKQIKKR